MSQPSRRDNYADVQLLLERLADDELMQLLSAAGGSSGLGCARVVNVGDSRVFTKSLPLTQLEHDHAYSTANLFHLPAFYHYGVGSAGFGAFRELVAHEKTTNWVLDGAIETFPLLYHHRILPFRGETFALGDDELDEYVTYWNGSAQIRNYMVARREARGHLVLFLEYVPNVLNSWLGANLDHWDMVMGGMFGTIDFLNKHDVGHFDAHLGNILTDGQSIVLSDFGLAVDSDFDLDRDERLFFQAHRHYDYGEFIRSSSHPLRRIVEAWDEGTTQEVSARLGELTLGTLLDNLEALHETGTLRLPDSYRAVLTRYADVIKMMDRTFTALSTGSKLEGGYDDDELRDALAAAKTC